MSENNTSWRFPGNSHTRENGLDTSDMETFMKDPIASLAREICQNSLDAKLSGDEPARLEFKTFEIKSDSIPGIDELRYQIQMAIDNWSSKDSQNERLVERLKLMYSRTHDDTIVCLRISDFNTCGLVGVSDNNSTKPFYMLTKGSGVSFKGGTSGGSKGIGKYATFVASEIHTLFYSTVTTENESGFIGVSKLCSGNIIKDGILSKEKTIGEGYYGLNEENEPVQSILNLDPGFNRLNSETGTDIFVIGFNSQFSWKETVISKIIESFMVAIFYNKLVVTVGNVIISKESLNEIVASKMVKKLPTKIKKQIQSQYILLSDKDVHTEIFDFKELGKVEFKLKSFSKEDSEYSTNNCIFVRYPYMKIKELKNISNLPCSALAIIGENKLNEVFRKFENPQHTDWEFKRSTFSDSEQNEARELFNELRDNIMETVIEVLSNSISKETDFEGAEDYLPDVTEGNFGNEESEVSIDTAKIQKKVKKRVVVSSEEINNGESETFDIFEGSLIDGEDPIYPIKIGEGNGHEIKPGDNPGDHESSDKKTFSRVPLTGIKYRLIGLDASNGIYAIKFHSTIEKNDCDLQIRSVDDSGNLIQIRILSAEMNKTDLKIENNLVSGISFQPGIKYSIKVKTDQKEYFSGDVIIYENR